METPLLNIKKKWKVSGEKTITGEVLQASDIKILQSFLALWKKREQEREATGEEAS